MKKKGEKEKTKLPLQYLRSKLYISEIMRPKYYNKMDGTA